MAAEERKEEEPLTVGEERVSKKESQMDDPKKTKVSISTDEPSTLVAASNDSEEEEEEEPGPSQVSLSQADEHIRRLENDGELNQVVGSQSMLSQELMYHSSQREEEDEGLAGLQCSQQTEASVSMARVLGLLIQEEDDPPSQDQSATPNQISSGAKANTPGNHRSLLSQVTSNETASASARPDMSQKFPDQRAFTPDNHTPPTVASAAKTSGIPDTPTVRESECFGSLLDAVQKITEQEEVNAKLYALQHHPSEDPPERGGATNPQEACGMRSSPTFSSSSMPSSKRKSSPPGEGSPTKKSRKSVATKKRESEQRKAQEIAKRAAALAEQTVADPEMAKKLLLSMALVRENPRTLPSTWPPRGSVVPEGFFWAHYPPLEAVLKKHMAEYYDLSTTKCQSAQQQAFNNDLVILVRDVAKEQGWKFHQMFSDKCLRDRIRCYYKTHIQNAKKRLRTMVRNPTKRANAQHLCSHLDLIEQHGAQNESESEVEQEETEEEKVTAPVATPATRVKKEPNKKPVLKPSTPTKIKKEPIKTKTAAKSPTKSRRSKPATKLAVV